MSESLSYKRQVECLIIALEEEDKSLDRRIDEAANEMETLNEESQIYAMRYGYADALQFERATIRRILKAARIAYEAKSGSVL